MREPEKAATSVRVRPVGEVIHLLLEALCCVSLFFCVLALCLAMCHKISYNK